MTETSAMKKHDVRKNRKKKKREKRMLN
jgi:hypothetical protein